MVVIVIPFYNTSVTVIEKMRVLIGLNCLTI